MTNTASAYSGLNQRSPWSSSLISPFRRSPFASTMTSCADTGIGHKTHKPIAPTAINTGYDTSHRRPATPRVMDPFGRPSPSQFAKMLGTTGVVTNCTYQSAP